SIFSAVETIIVDDFVISLDHVLAIACAAHSTHADNLLRFVIFCLVSSIHTIILGSTLVLKLVDRFPSVVTFGAALLGWIAGGMLITDILIVERFGEPSGTLKLAAEIIGAVLIVVVGRWLGKRKQAATGSV